jgi:hypothetical protein
MNEAVLLLGLLIIPGLIVLALLMEWLERTFAQRQVADAIARALLEVDEADDLEARVARAAEPLFQ